MKARFFSYTFLISSVIISGLVVLLIHSNRGLRNLKGTGTYEKSVLAPDREVEPRESITFILGDDKEADNPYYAQATEYFRSHPVDKTDELITYCRSMTEIRDYLANNPPANGRPWGLINLVVHGNQWLGLGLPIAPGLRRATTDRLIQYVEDGTLKEVPDSLLDEQSEIFLHGCGIGNNTLLMDMVGIAFGGKNVKPVVRASKLFEYYTTRTFDGNNIECKRYFAKAWFVNYRMGDTLSKDTIVDKLYERYPNDRINWDDAISRETPRYSGDTYHYTFEVPVLWLAEFENNDSIPDLSTDSTRLEWVKTQDELMETLARIEIPADKFLWKIRKIYKKRADGTRYPAIWVNGFCTVLCVIKPMLADEDVKCPDPDPFIPPLNDTTYFCMR